MVEKALLKLRERLGLSQEGLALALGVQGRLSVYRWEAGAREPSETIRRLILFLNDLPEKEARRFLEKLQSYGAKK